MQDLKHQVVKDQNRRSVPVMNLVQMAEMFVVQSSDNIRITSQGDHSLKLLAPEVFLHTNSTWEKMHYEGRLPHIVRYDEHGRKHEAYKNKNRDRCIIPSLRERHPRPHHVNTNGLEIDPESQELKRKMLNLSTYPSTLIHQNSEVVASVYKSTLWTAR